MKHVENSDEISLKSTGKVRLPPYILSWNSKNPPCHSSASSCQNFIEVAQKVWKEKRLMQFPFSTYDCNGNTFHETHHCSTTLFKKFPYGISLIPV